MNAERNLHLIHDCQSTNGTKKGKVLCNIFMFHWQCLSDQIGCISTSLFFVLRHDPWSSWFLRRVENLSSRRKTRQLKKNNQLQKFHPYRRRPNPYKGVLASTTATAAKTSLLKWISVFQTLSRLFQFTENVECRRISLPFIFLGTALKFRKRKKISSSLVYVLHNT